MAPHPHPMGQGLSNIAPSPSTYTSAYVLPSVIPVPLLTELSGLLNTMSTLANATNATGELIPPGAVSIAAEEKSENIQIGLIAAFVVMACMLVFMFYFWTKMGMKCDLGTLWGGRNTRFRTRDEIELNSRTVCPKGGSHLGGVGACVGCKVSICVKCGYCITKLADTKTHLRFGPKPYTRLNSLNTLRVQASCSNTSCNLRAFIPAPDLPRCNCTEFLINDIHHETCVSGHFCENCIWTALTHVSMARWFRRSSEELGITFTYYACNCGQECDPNYPVVCRLCGLLCYPFTLNQPTYSVDTETGAEQDMRPEVFLKTGWTWNDGDAHYYIDTLAGPEFHQRMKDLGLEAGDKARWERHAAGVDQRGLALPIPVEVQGG